MPQVISGSTFQQRRLERAASYVSDYWFPANPGLLSKIQTKLKDGIYEEDMNLLLTDVKSDFSLFTWCLKELALLLRKEGVEVNAILSPLELMRQAELEHFKRVLGEAERTLAFHTLSNSSDLQLSRFNEVAISASGAQALGESYGVDLEAAYSAAVLRQLGHILISWNYPEIYERAVQSLSKGDNLDVAIAQKLGFSPQLLAIKVLSKWGISQGCCENYGLIPEHSDEELEIINAIGASLAKVCKVSETLARANNPDVYPDARDDWQIARREIETRLGPQGMQAIRSKYEETTENYLTYVPHVFRAGIMMEFMERPADPVEEQPRWRNPFLKVCQPELQRVLREFYARLSPESLSRENARLLVRQTLPKTEFLGGCIYTIDPGIMMLVPQLEVGMMELRDFKPVEYSIVASGQDIISMAYQGNELVRSYKVSKGNQPLSAIAGVFGRSQRVGVLYLEALMPSDARAEAQQSVHFKALIWALNDSLGLE